MCNLNSKGGLTKKTLKFKLILKGGTPFLGCAFIQIHNVISQLTFEILEKLFQLSTSLKYFYPKRYKKLGDSKV